MEFFVLALIFNAVASSPYNVRKHNGLQASNREESGIINKEDYLLRSQPSYMSPIPSVKYPTFRGSSDLRNPSNTENLRNSNGENERKVVDSLKENIFGNDFTHVSSRTNYIEQVNPIISNIGVSSRYYANPSTVNQMNVVPKRIISRNHRESSNENIRSEVNNYNYQQPLQVQAAPEQRIVFQAPITSNLPNLDSYHLAIPVTNFNENRELSYSSRGHSRYTDDYQKSQINNNQHVNKPINGAIPVTVENNHIQKIISDPKIQYILSSTNHLKRYLIVYPNGTIDHVDRLESITAQNPNFVLVNGRQVVRNNENNEVKKADNKQEQTPILEPIYLERGSIAFKPQSSIQAASNVKIVTKDPFEKHVSEISLPIAFTGEKLEPLVTVMKDGYKQGQAPLSEPKSPKTESIAFEPQSSEQAASNDKIVSKEPFEKHVLETSLPIASTGNKLETLVTVLKDGYKQGQAPLSEPISLETESIVFEPQSSEPSAIMDKVGTIEPSEKVVSETQLPITTTSEKVESSSESLVTGDNVVSSPSNTDNILSDTNSKPNIVAENIDTTNNQEKTAEKIQNVKIKRDSEHENITTSQKDVENNETKKATNKNTDDTVEVTSLTPGVIATTETINVTQEIAPLADQIIDSEVANIKEDSPSTNIENILPNDINSTIQPTQNEEIVEDSEDNVVKKLDSARNGKPSMWFNTSDPDFWQKATDGKDDNIIYFFLVESGPRIERDTQRTVYPDGSILEEVTETVWKEGTEPKVTKTSRLIYPGHS